VSGAWVYEREETRTLGCRRNRVVERRQNNSGLAKGKTCEQGPCTRLVLVVFAEAQTLATVAAADIHRLMRVETTTERADAVDKPRRRTCGMAFFNRFLTSPLIFHIVGTVGEPSV
jgi:hypothetical protein